MKYAPILISILALAMSVFTFYWMNVREKKKFYLLRVDRMVNVDNPEFALVNGGSKHLLVTTIECGLESDEDGGCFYPPQRIEYGNNESLLIESGNAIHCKIIFPEPFTSSFAKTGTLLSNSVPEIYQHKFRINIAWIDSHGDNFSATAFLSKYGFRSDGALCMHSPLQKKHDLLKSALTKRSSKDALSRAA